MNRIILVFITLLIATGTSAQRAIGEWNDYLSYSRALKTLVAGDKIYCITEGGLFYYNTTDNSTNKITSQNGLSDYGIKTFAWNQEKGMLVLAYSNSNIDLVIGDEIANISDIKRKTIPGDKSVNNIFFDGNYAYLACNFGIVVINLDKREIKDTYLIGTNGGYLEVYDMEADGQYLYAATESGIYYAEKNNSNLLDYNNWAWLDDVPHAAERFSGLATFDGNLIACYLENELYIRQGNTWSRFLPEINEVSGMQVSGNYFTISGGKKINVVDNNFSVVAQITSYPFSDSTQTAIEPLDAAYSESKGLWIADQNFGLINTSGNYFESIYPNGPIDNSIYSLYTNEGDLWVASGGHDDSWNNIWKNPQFQLYNGQAWTVYKKKNIPEMSGFFDILCFAADPSDKNHLFVGSWGGGLLEFQNGEFVKRYTNNTPDCSLQTAWTADPSQPYVRIGGLAYDSKGNLWVSNSEVGNVLSVLTPEGKWESFNLPGFSSKTTGPLIVSQSNAKWMVAPRGKGPALYAVNSDNSKIIQLSVKSYFNNGEVELIVDMDDVYTIAEDLDGAIWLGTSKGVAVYYSPDRIWESGFLYATHPSLDENDGLYHPLLETETVTAIAIDGANRKWLGTKNSGIYLMSENGEKEIQHFTTDNSPLYSNTITSIAINQKTGEVFIGTNEGLISYQGEATSGNDDFANVLVYPNPVRETYSGPVTISGLVTDTDVKIADIAGNLVYTGTSLGGQAVWDGKNLNGNRVKTGVYLIFLSDKNGEKTHISKLLFIH